MTLKLFFGLIICICLALTICTIPAAANPADNGELTAYLVNTTNHIDTNAGGGYWLQSAHFNKIETFNDYLMLQYYGDYRQWSIQNKPADNASSEAVTYWDTVTNRQVSTGLMGFYVDMSNDLYVYLTFDNWNPYDLTGAVNLNISASYGCTGGGAICFLGSANTLNPLLSPNTWVIQGPGVTGGDAVVNNPDQVYGYSVSCPGGGTCKISGTSGVGRQMLSSSGFWMQYNRTPYYTSTLDKWDFTRVNIIGTHYLSNITLSYLNNGTYLPVYSGTSINNSFGQFVPAGTTTKLEVGSPYTSTKYTYFWYFTPTLLNDISFGYFNGNSVNTALNEKAATTIQFYTANPAVNIGKVVWSYTHSGNSNNPDTKTYIRNTTDNLWYLGGTGIGYDWGTVSSLTANFVCSDYNSSSGCNLRTTFTGTGRNSVYVTLYSNDFSTSVLGGAQVYVGNYAIVPNVIFNTEDATTQAAINVGGTYHIYDNTTSTDSTSTGATYAKDLTYGDVYTFWYIPNQFRVAFYRFSSNGINPWGNSYNDYFITAQWANWTGPRYVTAFISQAQAGYNTTTFQIVDLHGNPIPNVQVTTTAAIIPNVTYSDTTGIAAFSVPTSGTYQFTFTASGYQTYQYSLTVTKDIWTTITLNPGVATPTTTPTTAAPTVTPTTGPTPPAGGVTDFWGNIGYWLQLIGIPINQLAMVGAVAMIAIFTFGGMFVGGKAEQGGLGGLVGAIVGFISSAMVGWISMAWVAILMVICAVFFAAKFWPSGA